MLSSILIDQNIEIIYVRIVLPFKYAQKINRATKFIVQFSAHIVFTRSFTLK